MLGLYDHEIAQVVVIRKFTSSVASQTYQFDWQFYEDEFYWGWGREEITEEK